MRQIINSNTYPDWPNIEVDFYKPIDFFFDDLSGFDINSKSFKIVYLNETVNREEIKKYLIDNYNQFDAIITHYQDILDKCPNSHLLVRGTTWIKNYNFPKKEFSVSNLAGDKTFCEGHVLRQKIHYKQNRINIPKNFFVGRFPGSPDLFDGNKILVAEKNPLYTSQFNLSIENKKQENWFTEKIIDCFVTKTIPIYYGCPNIEKWFDIRGIFIVNDLGEMINCCNSLNENTYYEKKEYIDKNFELAQKYTTIDDRLELVIKNILK